MTKKKKKRETKKPKKETKGVVLLLVVEVGDECLSIKWGGTRFSVLRSVVVASSWVV